MTFLTVVRCDGPDCGKTLDGDALPTGWIAITIAATPSGLFEQHFCSLAHAAQWIRDASPSRDDTPRTPRETPSETPGEHEAVAQSAHVADESGVESGADAGRRILAFVATYYDEHGTMPSGPDVAAACDVGLSYTYTLMKKLRERGLLSRDTGVTDEGMRSLADATADATYSENGHMVAIAQ